MLVCKEVSYHLAPILEKNEFFIYDKLKKTGSTLYIKFFKNLIAHIAFLDLWRLSSEFILSFISSPRLFYLSM